LGELSYGSLVLWIRRCWKLVECERVGRMLIFWGSFRVLKWFRVSLFLEYCGSVRFGVDRDRQTPRFSAQ
jgi:hypothetical protein